MTAIKDEEVLTVAECARLLRIEVHLCRRLVANGTIPSIRLSERKILVPRELLRERIRDMAQRIEEGNVDEGSDDA